MPEVLTKHPDLVLQMLLETGKFKLNGKKTILTKCPDQSFLQVYDTNNRLIGELCVYGLNDIDHVTQFQCNDVIQNSRKCSLCHQVGHNRTNKKFH